MAITQLSPPDRFGGEVCTSKPRKWLMEPFARAPQVGLVFGEELPQLPNANEKFVDP
jgi:hypothetical protein